MYHDPRCRKEMYDQDVIMLQLGAAYMEPDEFVIRVLDKFNLVSWASPHYDQYSKQDDAIRQVATLVEEFFSTLIVVLGERFTPGVGKITSEEALKKEIIQLLCIEPMSHSALNRALAEDVRRETGLEKVVESVAAFKMPASGQSKGLYELKDEFYDQYNIFFYHYTREEQSKSEESQRSRLKAAGKPQCTPPPPVPEFTPQFAGAARVLDCDVLLYLLSEVLRRADNLKTRCFSEGQVHRALHLIGLCLNEEAAHPDTIKFKEKAEKFNILGLLEQLVGNQRIDSHKELLNWVIEKMRPPSTSDSEAGPSSGSPMTSQDDKAIAADIMATKKAAAAARRAKIMAQMMSAQKNFIKENSELFEESPSDKKNTSVTTEVEMKGGEDVAVVALGKNRSPPSATETEFVCILCQEEQSLSANSDALVMAAFTQRSTVMSGRRNGGKKEEDLPPLPPQYSSCPVLLADIPSAPHTSSCGHIMHAACWSKFYADIISHERQRTRGMRHPHSFDVDRREFLCPLCRRLSNAVIPLIPQFHILQPARKQKQQHSKDDEGDISFSGWIQGLMLALKYKRELSSEEETSLKVSEQNDAPLMMERTSMEDSDAFEVKGGSKKKDSHPGKNRFYTCPLDQVLQELQEGGLADCAEGFSRLYTSHEGSELKFADSVFDMMNDFCNSVFRAAFASSSPMLHDERIPMMAWQTCAYTTHSLVNARLEIDKKNPIFTPMPARHKDCLSALVRLCGIVGANFAEPKVVRSHALRLLSSLLEVDTANLSVLEFDAFGMLVALTFALPSLFNSTQAASLPSCDAQDNNIVHLLFLVHIVQILLTKDQFSTADADDGTEEMEGVESVPGRPVLDLLQLVRGAVGFTSDSDGSESLKERRVWRDLRSSSLPFLRCCAIFYQHLSDVSLSQIDISGQVLDDEKEFEILMGYLNLPTDPAELLGSSQVSKLAMRWANHPTVHITLAATSGLSPASHPLRMSPLMNLPDDYSELINNISCFVCPNSGSANSAAAAAARGAEESRVPALCLVCGQLLCSQSYCCQTQLDGDVVGACTAHADKCGAGNGIFLRVRECKVILLSGRKKGCSIAPPYLDR